MTLETLALIVHFQTALFGIGTILSLVKFKARQTYIKLLGLTLFSSVAGNIAQFILHYFKISVNYSASVYFVCIIPLISAVYFYAMKKRGKGVLIVACGVYVAFAVLNVLFIQKSAINSYTLIFQSIFVITLCLYYFYWLLQELPATKLNRLPMFWVNTGFIFFYSCNLFLFVFTSYLVNVLNNQLLVYWSLHNFVSIIEASMMIIALWVDLRNIKLLSSLPSAQ